MIRLRRRKDRGDDILRAALNCVWTEHAVQRQSDGHAIAADYLGGALVVWRWDGVAFKQPGLWREFLYDTRFLADTIDKCMARLCAEAAS